jgi:hypothetical protein
MILPNSGINLYKKIVMEMTNEQLLQEVLQPIYAQNESWPYYDWLA